MTIFELKLLSFKVKKYLILITFYSQNESTKPSIVWKIKSKSKIDIAEYDSEKEPPILTYSRGYINLKIGLYKKQNDLIIEIKRGKTLIEKFRFLGEFEMNSDFFKLKLLRLKLTE